MIETCVIKLKEHGLIVPIKGRDENSCDYHDYMVTVSRKTYYDWYRYKTDRINKKVMDNVKTLEEL